MGQEGDMRDEKKGRNCSRGRTATSASSTLIYTAYLYWGRKSPGTMQTIPSAGYAIETCDHFRGENI